MPRGKRQNPEPLPYKTVKLEKAFRYQKDFHTAELLLYDSPDLENGGNRIEFLTKPEYVYPPLSNIQIKIQLISPDGTKQTVSRSSESQVYFRAPDFIPLSRTEDGFDPKSIALSRCVLNIDVLYDFIVKTAREKESSKPIEEYIPPPPHKPFRYQGTVYVGLDNAPQQLDSISKILFPLMASTPEVTVSVKVEITALLQGGFSPELQDLLIEKTKIINMSSKFDL